MEVVDPINATTKEQKAGLFVNEVSIFIVLPDCLVKELALAASRKRRQCLNYLCRFCVSRRERAEASGALICRERRLSASFLPEMDATRADVTFRAMF
jgi:hypothetical protein